MFEVIVDWILNHIYFSIFLGVCAFFTLRQYKEGAQFTKRIDCHNKVIVITGANTGIGKETALALARRGGIIYLACRDLKKAAKACDDIKFITGNPNIFVRELDLASFESIRNFAKKFLSESNRLDILINNAGILACPKSFTKDGLEMQMGVNHFGHFLLTNLLLDLIKKSNGGRVINVSSAANQRGIIDKNNLNSENSYHPFKAYCNSKLANILFTKELSLRLQGTNVTVNAIHPGGVKTDIARNFNLKYYIFYILVKPFLKTAEAGCQTTLYAALDPDLDSVTGKYLEECKESKKVSKLAEDKDLAKWLWDQSEKITGLSNKN